MSAGGVCISLCRMLRALLGHGPTGTSSPLGWHLGTPAAEQWPCSGCRGCILGKGKVWLLPWLFAQFCPAAGVHGGDVCRACAILIAQLVNGEQHVLGFVSHLSVLQAALPVSRDDGLIPSHRERKAFHSPLSHHFGRHQLSIEKAGCKGSCCQMALQTPM